MSKRYVRLTPYDKRTGALCRRYMVGGALFQEGQWYELADAWASRLAPLRQGSGAPVFQILTAEQYRDTVRAELAAAYMRGGVSLAMAGALDAPTPGAPPKKGRAKSAFAGLSDAAEEADLATAGTVTAATVSPAPEVPAPAPAPAPVDDGPADDDGEVVDVDAIRTHAEADALAERYGVDLSSARTVAQKRDVLASELFTADDDD